MNIKYYRENDNFFVSVRRKILSVVRHKPISFVVNTDLVHQKLFSIFFYLVLDFSKFHHEFEKLQVKLM